MKAAVLHGKEDVRLEEVAERPLAPGEVRVRIGAALTCGAIAERFPEAVKAIMPMFRDGPSEHHGKHFDMPLRMVVPKPIQKPQSMPSLKRSLAIGQTKQIRPLQSRQRPSLKRQILSQRRKRSPNLRKRSLILRFWNAIIRTSKAHCQKRVAKHGR